MDNQKFEKDFSEESFWNKIKNIAKKAGRELIFSALVLYYTLPIAPAKEKAIIIGALGYLISPLDAIPDTIPVIGFTDDIAVLAWSLVVVAHCITQENRDKANKKCDEWFGEERNAA